MGSSLSTLTFLRPHPWQSKTRTCMHRTPAWLELPRYSFRLKFLVIRQILRTEFLRLDCRGLRPDVANFLHQHFLVFFPASSHTLFLHISAPFLVSWIFVPHSAKIGFIVTASKNCLFYFLMITCFFELVFQVIVDFIYEYILGFIYIFLMWKKRENNIFWGSCRLSTEKKNQGRNLRWEGKIRLNFSKVKANETIFGATTYSLPFLSPFLVSFPFCFSPQLRHLLPRSYYFFPLFSVSTLFPLLFSPCPFFFFLFTSSPFLWLCFLF